MTKLSTARMIGAVSGLVISCFALVWLMSLNSRYHDIPSRIGFISAVICALGSLTFCWAASAAYVARKRDWSPRTCRMAGTPLLVLALIACIADSHFWRVFLLVATNNAMVGFLCRKLAYPDVTDEQASAPEPPISLFQK
jgi:Na+/melibiose symporter-like transporter